MARTPRPAARILLASRFVVPRASLVALPDGPVVGLDLASGELVGLAFGPSGDDPSLLCARIARWNELALPGCPGVREIGWQLGRPLLVFDHGRARAHGEPVVADMHDAIERCAALCDRIAAAGLGLPAGPADLELGARVPRLRRPAIWARDAVPPLALALRQLGSRRVEQLRSPEPAAAERPIRHGPVRRAFDHDLVRSPRARLALLVVCGVIAIVGVASSTDEGAHPATVAALPLPTVAPSRPAPAVVAPRPLRAHAVRPPSSRGGPAQVLVAPIRRRAAARVAPTRARVEPAAVRQPEAGWVEGLFVGS